jgi:hypothetical protein
MEVAVAFRIGTSNSSHCFSVKENVVAGFAITGVAVAFGIGASNSSHCFSVNEESAAARIGSSKELVVEDAVVSHPDAETPAGFGGPPFLLRFPSSNGEDGGLSDSSGGGASADAVDPDFVAIAAV